MCHIPITIVIHNRPFDTSTTTTFTKVTVQGGGKLTIETQGEGTTLQGEEFIVESGGLIEVDKLTLIADTLTVEDSAEISANGKVNIFISMLLLFDDIT